MNKIASYAIFYWARTGFNAQLEFWGGVLQ
jgi:hypothetical protein